MQLKERPLYLDKLIAFQDKPFIKVLVGMRRCGKSSLLHLFADHLRASGIPADRIISMNMEAAEYLPVTDSDALLSAITAAMDSAAPASSRFYLLLDEVQLVDGWERAVNALRARNDTDIYLTGSNAYLLSSQLATLLSGRYVEIRIYPLSFSEFARFSGEDLPKEALFTRYATYGGLPPVVEQGDERMLAQTVLSGIYNTVFVKDIAQHNQIRNVAVFSDIARYIADTAGSSVSIVNMENRLRAAHRKTSSDTIERYLQALVDAFLFYRARRFDLKGGAFLQGLEKYYCADLGIKNMLLGFPDRDFGFTLENAVHNELLVRGFDAQVGKTGSLEVDFVATMGEESLYVQVCASLLDESTRERELAPLRQLAGRRGRKIVLTYDTIGLGWNGDIEIANALDWMLEA